MSESPDPPRQRLFALTLSLAATLVLLLLGGVGVEAYQDRRWVEARLTTLARMELAGEEIVRLDEVFTRSARLAVADGTLDPSAPSRRVDPRVDQYVQEVLRLDPRALDGVAAAMTAGAALAAMEDHALGLLRQGENAEAQRLLSSGEYAAQKEMHAKGMATFNRNLRQDRDRARVEARAIVRRIAAQSILTSVLLLFGVWWAVLVERRWHAAIKKNNRRLRQKAAELGELNNQLDRRVSERTKHVNESALASLNMMQDAVAAKSDLEMTNKRLQESEERFAGAFEHAPIGMALVSPEGRWLKVNRQVCDLLGYSAAELSTRTFQDITHPEDLEGDLANVSRIISGDIRSYQMEKRYIHKRGHTITVLLSVSLVRDAQRQPRYFVSQIQDITESRQAEARYLRQRDALIDLTMGADAPDAEDPAAALRRITETAAATLGVARVSIWRYTGRRAAIRAVDLYEQVSGRHSAGMELSATDYPAYFRALASVEVISADDACRDPRTGEFASGYLQPLGITAMLDAPIQIGGAVDGVLCHEHVGSRRVWTADEKTFVVAMANLVSLALEGVARRQAEEALRQSIAQLAMEKARLIAAQAVAKVGSWETDTMTWAVTWSDETHHIFETDPRTFKPSHQGFLQRVHPDDRRMVDEAFTGSLAVNSDFAIEHRVLMKDGRIKTVEERWHRLLDDKGQSLCVLGTCQDITERKQAEAALGVAEAKFRSIYENSTEGIFQTTPEGRFISGNAALARILGYASPEELVHERTDLKRQGYTDPARRDEFKRLIEEQGSINSFEYESWRRDGTRLWISENSRIVRDAAGHAAYYEGSLQDVTARKRAEQALQEANRGLEGKVAERTAELKAALRAKDMFMANMSHELRTPLNAILGFTGTLLMKLPGAINAQQEEQLNIVKASARHLLSLINDLLDLAKIESGNMQVQTERVNCRKVLEDIAVSLRPQAETKGLSLALLAPDQEIHVSTDARALKQIVLNLCSNAIKFTETGSVTVELKGPVGGQPVEIGVTDTGIGIKPEDQDKLFKVFSQMDSTRRDGTGLGLHLSQKLAQLINGKVHFTSDFGHGSRFWLTLPQE